MKMKHWMLIAAIVASAMTAAVASIISPGGIMIAYGESIIAGSVAATLFLVLAIHAWGKEPPLEGLAWIFGHLFLWATSYTIEEISWFVWGFHSDYGYFFIERLAPFLKATQGISLAGLMVFAWYYSKGVTGDKLSVRLRASWAILMTASSALIIFQGLVF